MPVANVSRLFAQWGLLALWLGMSMGLVGAVPFIWPEVGSFAFQTIRPLHVTLVVAWILAGASACVYQGLAAIASTPKWAPTLAKGQLTLAIATLSLILWDYVNGRFGGREYLEFDPRWSPVIALVAVLFAINVVTWAKGLRRPLPVYAWMWLTGAVGLPLAFAEAQLWLLPEVGQHVVRDLTFQWKANGSLIGCWNMLVYGTQLFWLEKLHQDSSVSRSRTAFFFYFLGLFNLLFNWGHHLYPAPISPVVKGVAYAVSMTEWLILLKWLRDWRRAKPLTEHPASPFFRSVEYWVAINLLLALLLSIPAVNQFTHGTPITLAHAMGSTIGINTFILWGALTGFWGSHLPQRATSKLALAGNIALALMFAGLMVAGIGRGVGLQQIQPLAYGVVLMGGLGLWATASGFAYNFQRRRGSSF